MVLTLYRRSRSDFVLKKLQLKKFYKGFPSDLVLTDVCDECIYASKLAVKSLCSGFSVLAPVHLSRPCV